jgi:polyhydroxybutyrate depolymerase
MVASPTPAWESILTKVRHRWKQCALLGPVTRDPLRPWALLVVLVLAGSAIGTGCWSATASAGSTHLRQATFMRVTKPAPVPSVGCRLAPSPSVTNQREDITVSGVDRWYLLSTPAPPAQEAASNGSPSPEPRPLVLDFHGLAEGAVVHSTTTQFGALGQQDGFVVAFPNGTGSPVQWNVTAPGSSNPDLQFVTAMLTQLESTQCIDTSRVYASGFSDGSFMVSQLACTMSTKFAAIAAVSGLQLPRPCQTKRRVPIITFHGTADPILFFNGGVGTATLNQLLGRGSSASGSSSTTTTTQPARLNGAGYPATVKAWAEKDGCSPTATDTRISSQIILRSYRCPAKTAVAFYIIIGGGHAWPGSAFSRAISKYTGFTTFQINATNSIWAFFRRFQL